MKNKLRDATIIIYGYRPKILLVQIKSVKNKNKLWKSVTVRSGLKRKRKFNEKTK